MDLNNCISDDQVAQVLKDCIQDGNIVEIDGVGTFVPDASRGFRFLPCSVPKVFIAYVEEDAESAERLYEDLEHAGLNPWLDRRKLLPGQNWPRSIEDAIETSDFFIGCFSSRSVSKKGGFQSEIRYALDCARRIPLEEIFLIPVRLDACPVPAVIRREWQYIDLFPQWQRGVRRVLSVMRRQVRKRAA